jgi:hypothetical protein
MGCHRGVVAFEVRTPVTGHPFALEQQFHHLGSEPDIKLLFDQRIGHRVVMPVNLDMIIDIDAGASPLGIFIRMRGQRT